MQRYSVPSFQLQFVSCLHFLTRKGKKAESNMFNHCDAMGTSVKLGGYLFGSREIWLYCTLQYVLG